MEIVLNYDLLEAIKNVNEPFGPRKIIRNQKERFFLLIPLGASLACYLQRCYGIDADIKEWLKWLRCYLICSTTSLGTDFFVNHIFCKKFNSENDIWATISIIELKKLVLLLKNINVNTSFNMLLDSELYNKELELLHDSILPTMISKKYIYIPTYDDYGNDSKTSVVQEHIIGSKEYTLSIGTPHKKYRRVLVNSH